jgi:uncharacterized surface anchored protein
VQDSVLRGTARIRKIDADTGATVGGARLTVAYDADRDGTFEQLLPPILTDATTSTVLSQLLPGDYQLIEVDAPNGYVRRDEPVRFSVSPGADIAVAIDNRAIPVTTTTTTTTPTTTAPKPPTTVTLVERSLPRTGDSLRSLGLLGAGLTLLGTALVRLQRMLPVCPKE